MRLSVAILVALIYGWGEQVLFRMTGWRPRPVIGPFAWYHLLVMGPLFIGVGLLTYWPVIPTLFVIEDSAFFLFHPSAVRGPDSWVNFGLGGRWVASLWLPHTYVLAVGLSVLFWVVEAL